MATSVFSFEVPFSFLKQAMGIKKESERNAREIPSDCWAQVYTFLNDDDADSLRQVSWRPNLAFNYQMNPWHKFPTKFSQTLGSSEPEADKRHKTISLYRGFEDSLSAINAHHIEYISSHHNEIKKYLLQELSIHLNDEAQQLSMKLKEPNPTRMQLASALSYYFSVIAPISQLQILMSEDYSGQKAGLSSWDISSDQILLTLSDSDFFTSIPHLEEDVVVILKPGLRKYLIKKTKGLRKISADKNEMTIHLRNLTELWCLNRILTRGKSLVRLNTLRVSKLLTRDETTINQYQKIIKEIADQRVRPPESRLFFHKIAL